MLTIKRWVIINSTLFSFLIFSVFLFSFLGNPVLSPFDLGHDPMARDLFFGARLPRVLLALCVGASLSTSGVVFQSLLRNPLADPYILGVSGGAALGGVVSLAIGLPYPLMSVIAFLFALGTLFLVYFMAQVKGRLPSQTLLLTGIVFNAFAFALILLINSLTNMGEIHQILYLLMGSLEAQELKTVAWLLGFTAVGLAVVMACARPMNVISLGEEPASQLGIDPDRLRKILFFAASLLVGASVALAGLIGFVGLFVPHILRLAFGPDHRLLLPASALGGGIFLITCDFAAKTLFSGGDFQTQIPVGVITALIGGPFFVFLLKRGR
ncbi:MAG: iron ABC transporter permease [Deltaproteobacteria bacterium]|nr:iron ABC transporter permease [Deltaproteobacteria bacterium]